MYFLVYAIFMCELQKIFFLRDMMDNQCANIFSTHATVYGSHSVKFAYIERENIFLHGYPQLLFFFLVFPHLLNFFQNCFLQNLCCFPYFYRGRKLFLKSMLFIRGVPSIFYWAYVLCSLNSLFSLILCCVCLLATLC